MLAKDTRVKRINEYGTPVGSFGTVLETNQGHVFVKWDDGWYSVMSEWNLVPIHKLKAQFKHGLRLVKRAS